MKRATMKENCAIMKTNDDFKEIIIFDNRRKQLEVSEQCFEKLGSPEWVQVQMNAEQKSITLMASNQNNDDAIRVDKNTDFDGIFITSVVKLFLMIFIASGNGNPVTSMRLKRKDFMRICLR